MYACVMSIKLFISSTVQCIYLIFVYCVVPVEVNDKSKVDASVLPEALSTTLDFIVNQLDLITQNLAMMEKVHTYISVETYILDTCINGLSMSLQYK